MKSNKLIKNKKDLNRLDSKRQSMKRGAKSKEIELTRAIKEAQKDPEFIREINKFIKATTKIHKLY